MFWSFHPLADKTNNEHLPKSFFKVTGMKSLYGNTRSQRYFVFCCPLSFCRKSSNMIHFFLDSTAHIFVVVLCFYSKRLLCRKSLSRPSLLFLICFFRRNQSFKTSCLKFSGITMQLLSIILDTHSV